MSPISDDILLEERDGVATVVLNRPHQRNALSYHMWLDLQRIAVDLEASSTVRAVVFRGAGQDAFSAGADIKDFDLYRDTSAKAHLYAAAVDGAMDAVEAISKPTIALILGYCVGGGLELTHACDLRVAADNSRLGITAAKLGIAIGYREMRRLAQLVGRGGALYILLTGRLVDSQEALRMGLVHQVVPLEGAEECAYALAQEVAQLAPLSHAAHKAILEKVLEGPGLEGQTPEEEALPFLHFDTEDYRQARRAFIEKRPPQFLGR